MTSSIREHAPPLSAGVIAFFVLTRVATSALKYVLPDLEPNYILTARALFERTGGDLSYFPIPYPVLLYALHALVRDWVLTSHVLYITFSTATGIATYALVQSIYNRSVARHAFLLSAVMPNYTAAVIGYSHTPVVALGFLMIALYAFWRLSNDEVERVRWCVMGTLAACGAMLVRPESLFCCLILLAIWLWRRGSHQWARRAATALVMGGTVLAILIGVARVSTTLGPDEPIGLFGNARYAYNTYMSTLSMRALKGESDRDVSNVLADRAFGPAAENGYSIFRAIARNPKEAAKNVAYNIRSLINAAGHPLFMPLFLYPLVGIGLVSQSALRRPAGWLVIASVIPATVASLLFLHVEERYMMPLVLPFVVLIAAALDRFDAEGRRYVVWSTYGLTGLVSLTYLLYFHMALV